MNTWHRIICAMPCVLALSAAADEIQVAVAANFTEPAKRIAADFEKDTGHRVRLSFGATGTFYAQIEAGAPFDVLLAADEATPKKIVDMGRGVADTRRTYAIGRLVLWSATPGLVDARGAVLASGRFRHLAVADPKLAPYGLAAQQALRHLGLAGALGDRLVTAGNIAQAYEFVATGNAELGFVALGQVQPPDGSPPRGSMWRVPDNLYDPLRQDVVVLSSSHARAAATAFVGFLGTEKAHAVMKDYGYGW